MSKWIDADEMLEYLDLMYEHQDDKDEPYNIGILGAINYIKHKAPSIDIVFCKECRKTKDDFIKGDKLVWCGKWKTVMGVNEFCSRGEREGE